MTELAGLEDASRPFPRTSCLHELFEEQVERTPAAIAVVDGEERVAYAELNRRANRLARELRARGVEREVVVAVLLERSVGHVVALLAILKAGGACLPLDPAHPPLRHEQMLTDSRAALLISRADEAARLSAHPPVVSVDAAAGDDRNLGLPTDPSSLVCVFYTSGTTRAPRGVEIVHTGVVNEACWTRRAMDVTPGTRSTWMSSPAFAVSRWELWSYLLAGAEIHIVPEEAAQSPERFRDWLLEREVAIAFVITWLAERLMVLPWPEVTPLRTLITGGEAVRRWPSPTLPFDVVVSYGITEVSSVRLVCWANRDGRSGSGPPPIGRPIDNTRVYVLDERGRPVPPGVVGELYIGGEGLARGYRGRPELTAERFVPDPFATEPEARMYRTGDLARVLPSGELAFAGRADDQAKLRGARAEPEEIESLLTEHESVDQVAVTIQEGVAGARLVAFVVPAGDEPLDRSLLRAWLADRLPAHLLPSIFASVESLPMSANGKLDRRALRSLEISPAARASHAPHTAAEIAVAELWHERAAIAAAGVDDDFFELGGDSLAALRVLGALERFGAELTLRDFVRDPTIGALARVLERGRAPRRSAIRPSSGAEVLAGLSAQEAEALTRHLLRESEHPRAAR
jgi:amino acid adenylation domain-containing protein